jgi:hypothetical protein
MILHYQIREILYYLDMPIAIFARMTKLLASPVIRLHSNSQIIIARPMLHLPTLR